MAGAGFAGRAVAAIFGKAVKQALTRLRLEAHARIGYFNKGFGVLFCTET